MNVVKSIVLLFCCINISNVVAMQESFLWYVSKKISCYGDNLTLLVNYKNNEDSQKSFGVYDGKNLIIIDTKIFLDYPKGKYHVIHSATQCGMIINSLNEMDMVKPYYFFVGFVLSLARNLTYSEVFGEINGKPCNEFDKNNCTSQLCKVVVKDEVEKDDEVVLMPAIVVSAVVVSPVFLVLIYHLRHRIRSLYSEVPIGGD